MYKYKRLRLIMYEWMWYKLQPSEDRSQVRGVMNPQNDLKWIKSQPRLIKVTKQSDFIPKCQKSSNLKMTDK